MVRDSEGKTVDDFVSIIDSVDKVENIRTRYDLSLDLEARAQLRPERANSPPEGRITVYDRFMHLGLKFPLFPLFEEIVQYYKTPFARFTPNLITFVLGFAKDWYIVKRRLRSGVKKMVEAYGGSPEWKPDFLFAKIASVQAKYDELDEKMKSFASLHISKEELHKWCAAFMYKMLSTADIASFPGDVPTIFAKGPSEEDSIPNVPDEYMGIELEDADEATKEDVADTDHSGVQRNTEDASQNPSKDHPPGSDADSWPVHHIHLMVLSEEQLSEYSLYSMISGILRGRANVHSIETVADLENDLLDAMRMHNVKVNQHLINEIKELREEMQRCEIQSLKDYGDSLTFETEIHDDLVILEKENARLRERTTDNRVPLVSRETSSTSPSSTHDYDQNPPIYCSNGYIERESS
ncbi:OLC1v1008531C1 [Oldenlandia corymbosa var. corymbosa]|uniref:OLC1v1008531C1 n=1 Tax=Oldenlandia corymbosa var. corymbosa TaxID=529605 RepID=A0AAV1DPB0_OLDCO|nr:OLC1v1008531C1 [Oldenlandia corymbosa var. corymbosa]